MIGDRLRRRILSPPKTRPDTRGAGKSLMIEYSVRFFIAFALSGARVFSTLSPFAVGVTAAAASPGGAVASLLGAVMGYLIFGSLFWAVKYIAATLLVCTVLIVFRDSHISVSSLFMPLCAVVVTACVGFVSAAESGWGYAATVLLVTDCVLAGGSAYFYKRALSPWSGKFEYEHNSEIIHLASVLILLATVLISLSAVKIMGVLSIGRTIAVLIVFLASYRGGVGVGCSAGVAIGLAMDAASGGAPIFSAAYGFAGLIAGIFAKRNRLVFAVTFIIVDAAAALLGIGSANVPAILYETFTASAVFMILPNSFFSRVSALLPQNGRGSGAVMAREYTKKRVDGASLAFRDLYETVREKTGHDRNDADIASVFDRAADLTCRKCQNAVSCWQTGYQTTLTAMNDAAPLMLERGRLETEDFPSYFSSDCTNLSNLITAVNAELRGLIYRRQYRSRLRENQNAAFNQYSDISSILEDISEELGEGVVLESELESRLGKYIQSLGINGDAAVFRDRGGRLHAEISGMKLNLLKKDAAWLDKLSAVLGTRICCVESSPQDKIILLEAEPLAAVVGISCLKKEGQDICGDKGAYFKTDEGILYVILSDGMGAGETAARYSSDTVRILERFLRSGVAAETAVRMLNDLLLLKNEDDTGCATVDLVSINLFTGETGMYKYGAAPSYLKQNGVIRRIRGNSLAAGLGSAPNDAPDYIKMELVSGCAALIVSDGITAGGDDGWLEDILLEYSGSTPRDLTKIVIDAAAERNGKDDDMTAIAIQVTHRD